MLTRHRHRRIAAAGLAAISLGVIALVTFPLHAAAEPAGPTATAPGNTTVPADATTGLTGLSISDATTWGLERPGYSPLPLAYARVTLSTTLGTLGLTYPLNLVNLSGTSWSGSTLEFAGSVYSIQEALKSATLTLGESATGSATVTLTATPYSYLDGTYYFEGSGHFYRFVSGNEIDADAARTAAKSQTLLGGSGYLAHIPSQQVSDFLSSAFSSTNYSHAWIGARAVDEPLESGDISRTWQWIDGPRDGQAFTTCTLPGADSGAAALCSAVDGAFTNWAVGEPNDTRGGEDAVVTNWERDWENCMDVSDPRCPRAGLWNDMSPGATWIRGVRGYLVEFAGDADLTPRTAHASAELSIVPVPPTETPTPTLPAPTPTTPTAGSAPQSESPTTPGEARTSSTPPATPTATGTPTGTPAGTLHASHPGTAAGSMTATTPPAATTPTPSRVTATAPPATPPPPISAGDSSGNLTADNATPAVGTPLVLTAAGFRPGSIVHFYLHSDPTYLGYGVADADGVARVQVTVPRDFDGNHTVQSVGTGHDGHARNLILPITVHPQASLATTGITVGMVSLFAAELLGLGVAMLRIARLAPPSESRGRARTDRHTSISTHL